MEHKLQQEQERTHLFQQHNALQRTAWSKTTNGPLAIAGGSKGAAVVRLQIEWRGGGIGTGR